MVVDEVLSFDEYWLDPRFEEKKPSLRGSLKQAFGDNIYHRDSIDCPWQQEDSHHSLGDGSRNERNIAHDTQVNRVLIASNFVYFGGEAVKIPANVRDVGGFDICAIRGHKSRFPVGLVEEFAGWFESLGDRGFRGVPHEWLRPD